MNRFTRLLVAAGLLAFVLGGCDQSDSSRDDHDADAEHVDDGSPGQDNEHGPDDDNGH